MTTNATTVKNCPVCNGTRITVDAAYGEGVTLPWYVECDGRHCFVAVHGATRADAIERWNTRPGEDEAYRNGRTFGFGEGWEGAMKAMRERMEAA